MSKRTDFTTRPNEVWMVRNDGRKAAKSPVHGEKRPVPKVAVRNSLGQFHGATNFRGSFGK